MTEERGRKERGKKRIKENGANITISRKEERDIYIGHNK